MYKVITFDMYSATMDINGTAIPQVAEILNCDMDFAKTFFTTWRSQQWNYLLLNNSLQTGYISYWDITKLVLDYTCNKFDRKISQETYDKLMNVWLSFKPWPEATQVLKTLKERGYKIGMLSNGDQEMMLPLQENCGVKFDYIFSSGDAFYYKPHPDVYKKVLETLNMDSSEVLHVAGSMFDVTGTVSAGMDCAWSNRHGESVLNPKYQPTFNMNNLTGLLDILK